MIPQKTQDTSRRLLEKNGSLPSFYPTASCYRSKTVIILPLITRQAEDPILPITETGENISSGIPTQNWWISNKLMTAWWIGQWVHFSQHHITVFETNIPSSVNGKKEEGKRQSGRKSSTIFNNIYSVQKKHLLHSITIAINPSMSQTYHPS